MELLPLVRSQSCEHFCECQGCSIHSFLSHKLLPTSHTSVHTCSALRPCLIRPSVETFTHTFVCIHPHLFAGINILPSPPHTSVHTSAPAAP